MSSGVVVADALDFHDAPDDVVELLRNDLDGHQYFLRALLFRAITACLARSVKDNREDRERDDAVRYDRAIDVALEYAKRSPD